jgi:hypothetical protein
MSSADLNSVHAALISASERLTERGRSVSLLRSTYLPGQRRWIGTFKSDRETFVFQAIELAQLSDVGVTTALEFET